MSRRATVAVAVAAVAIGVLLRVRSRPSGAGPSGGAAWPAEPLPMVPAAAPSSQPGPPGPEAVGDVTAPAVESSAAAERASAAPFAEWDEQALLSAMRAAVKIDPAWAEAVARESRRRFPRGESADERDALLVDALVNQQRIGRARDESYYYFRNHPGGRFAEHLFTVTGARPAPSRPGSLRLVGLLNAVQDDGGDVLRP